MIDHLQRNYKSKPVQNRAPPTRPPSWLAWCPGAPRPRTGTLGWDATLTRDRSPPQTWTRSARTSTPTGLRDKRMKTRYREEEKSKIAKKTQKRKIGIFSKGICYFISKNNVKQTVFCVCFCALDFATVQICTVALPRAQKVDEKTRAKKPCQWNARAHLHLRSQFNVSHTVTILGPNHLYGFQIDTHILIH